MKNILLIGLGRFGRHCARKLNELGHQVMAVDVREDRVDTVLPYVTDGLIGNSTRADFMKTLGVRNFDVCIVAIGDDFQSSLETTALLKDLGAQHVVARAARDVHARFLAQFNDGDILRFRRPEQFQKCGFHRSFALFSSDESPIHDSSKRIPTDVGYCLLFFIIRSDIIFVKKDS